jgi:hypothetical protein
VSEFLRSNEIDNDDSTDSLAENGRGDRHTATPLEADMQRHNMNGATSPDAAPDLSWPHSLAVLVGALDELGMTVRIHNEGFGFTGKTACPLCGGLLSVGGSQHNDAAMLYCPIHRCEQADLLAVLGLVGTLTPNVGLSLTKEMR